MKNTTMTKNILILFNLFLIFAHSALSQISVPYTNKQYQYDSLLNIEYGSTVDYAGNNQSLILDIYKPKNDTNCNRPILILVHGGAWIGGSKEDADLILLSREFAKRGYVVANINYRLGTHKTSNYSMYALCNNSISAPCGYICDSAEVYRANYRSMQDTKGAIRFMKNRFLLDSSDVNNVFVVGESAGAFAALAVAFMTDESEKPLNCAAISAAPSPDSDMTTYGCVPLLNNLTRPDLGTVEGTLNLGTHDASVQGVGSFFGGILDMSIVENIPENFPVYLFHQGADVIVNYDFGKVLGRISWECFAQTNICQTYYFYPNASGGKRIGNKLTAIGWNTNLLQMEIIENYEYLNDCFDNGHSIDNLTLRAQNISDLFAAKIATNGNVPSETCLNELQEYLNTNSIKLSPNPVEEILHIQSSTSLNSTSYEIISLTGEILLRGNLTTNQIDLNTLSKGYYILLIKDKISCKIPFIKN
jgi:hypothetical protein